MPDESRVLQKNQYRVPRPSDQPIVASRLLSADPGASPAGHDWSNSPLLGDFGADSIAPLLSNQQLLGPVQSAFKRTVDGLFESVELAKKLEVAKRIKRKIELNKKLAARMRFKYTNYANVLIEKTKQLAFESKVPFD